MLSLPRGMLDGEDDDFRTRFIDGVVNEVRILSGDQLAYALYGLCSAHRNKTRFWSE
jgi:hypothetical protein